MELQFNALIIVGIWGDGVRKAATERTVHRQEKNDSINRHAMVRASQKQSENGEEIVDLPGFSSSRRKVTARLATFMNISVSS
jgi:hypothetical protein